MVLYLFSQLNFNKPLSPFVATCRRLSPVVATCCRLSPVVAGCRRLSPVIAVCRRLSPFVPESIEDIPLHDSKLRQLKDAIQLKMELVRGPVRRQRRVARDACQAVVGRCRLTPGLHS